MRAPDDISKTGSLVLRRLRRPAAQRRGFSLVELLVVVAIVAMLLAILMPSLSRARAQSRLSVCLSNLHEIGLGIQAYAYQYNGAIPRGIAEPMPYFPTQGWDEWATNQVRIGMLGAEQGLGPLLARDITQPRVLFCPADDTNDPVEELAKVERRGDEDAFCSYLYRQRDQTTRDRLNNLGENGLGLPARALVFDANSLGAGDLWRTNHQGRQVNILYLDGHGETLENRRHVFSLREQDYFGFPVSVERRLNEILVAADYAETDDPRNTPPLP
jgi:prepilin-type N-terminal cleavage/methylation domain-containing protein/prepilin-type processing-associated H-X9-DG protein